MISLADLHWNAIDPVKMMQDLDQPLYFIENFHVDLVVIPGDYFDSKLPLNSTSAINALQWVDKLIKVCKRNGVLKIRVFKGTEEHDNDQLEALRSREDVDGYFKIFNYNTYEETLPGLTCLYCPDENINAKDYIMKYYDNIIKRANIGFYHGSFDVVLPNIVVQMSEETSAKSIIFEYNFWEKMIRGPMISAHWHDGTIIDNLIYVGTYQCWAFNEEEEKGMGFIQYNTDNHSYFYKKIPNLRATIYKTLNVNTLLYTSLDQYASLMRTVDQYLQSDPDMKIRILITIDDDKDENETFITSLRQYFMKMNNVKFTIKNTVKAKKKTTQAAKYNELKTKYDFVFNKSSSMYEKFHDFIQLTQNEDIPIDVIEQTIKKYSK